MKNEQHCFLGVDLGQRNDYTAIAGVERVTRQWRTQNRVTWGWEAKEQVRLCLRYLERVPLGTPYPKVVERVAGLARQLRGRSRCSVVVDATGVGAPVVDALREADLRGAELMPVVITPGDHARYGHGRWRVPKADLVGGLQRCLEDEELRVAAGLKEFDHLVEEMRGFTVRVTEGAEMVFGGKKDDLVIALALAAWGARLGTVGERWGPIPGMPGPNEYLW